MKVQLIVVRGKPEGKVIPLAGPKFKIGRGETCHLRPNSEQVSREHAEFTIESSAVIVRDLGSRNGTLVNGKALTTEACKLKDRDLVQVGPLTFAVSIHDAPKPATPPTASPAASAAVAQAKAKPSPDDVPAEDIDSWLFGDNTNTNPTVDQPTVVCGGDPLTITAFRDAQSPPAQPSQPPSVADDAEYERQTEAEELETQDDRGRPATRKPRTKRPRPSKTLRKSSWTHPTRSMSPRRHRKSRARQGQPVAGLISRNSRTAATRPTTSSED